MPTKRLHELRAVGLLLRGQVTKQTPLRTAALLSHPAVVMAEA